MAKFVVLHHVLPTDSSQTDHFDLMLEDGGMLATWRIGNWPPGSDQRAVQLADHRRAYLDYEGLVSGNRGTVTRVCQGDFESLFRNDQRWVLKIATQEGQETLTLQRQKTGAAQCWTLSLVSATTPSGPFSD